MVVHICQKCGLYFDRKSTYDYHINKKIPCVKAGDRYIVKCNHCAKEFSTKGHLDRHLNLCSIKKSSIDSNDEAYKIILEKKDEIILNKENEIEMVNKNMKVYDLLNNIYKALVTSVKSVKWDDTRYIKYFENDGSIVPEDLPCPNLMYRNIIIHQYLNSTAKLKPDLIPKLHKDIINSAEYSKDANKENYRNCWIEELKKQWGYHKYMAMDIYYYAVKNNYLEGQTI
jgi:uncharacterized C2H2 Zn-finger protein